MLTPTDLITRIDISLSEQKQRSQKVFDVQYPCRALSEEDWRFLFLGYTESPCTSPCSAFHTRTKFISSVRESSKDHFRVKLFFSPKMQVITTIDGNMSTTIIYTIHYHKQVTTTDFVKPTLSTLLSDVREKCPSQMRGRY